MPAIAFLFARGEARGWTFQLCSRLHFLLVVRRTSFMGSTGEMLLFVSCVVNLFTSFLFSIFLIGFLLFIFILLLLRDKFDITLMFLLSMFIFLYVCLVLLLMLQKQKKQQPWLCLHHFVLFFHLSFPVVESFYIK